MKLKIWKIGALMLAGVLLLSGCGEKLTKLTAEQEQKIVNYSAYVIGEFNKDQKKGYTPIGESTIEKYQQREQAQNSNDTSSNNAETAQNQDTNSDNSTNQTSDGESTGTMNDALGLQNLSASFTKYEVKNSYVENDAYLLTADKGYTYIILYVSVKNSTKSKQVLDMLSKSIQFTLQVNDTNVDLATTMLLNDLSTYSDTIKAGKNANTVLLFPVKEDVAKQIQTLKLTVTEDKNVTTVNLIP